MKITMQNLMNWTNWKATTTLLTIGTLALIFTTGASPKKSLVRDSVYPDGFNPVAARIYSYAPGPITRCPNRAVCYVSDIGISWDNIQSKLELYPGYPFHGVFVVLNKNSAGAVVSVTVTGIAGGPGSGWPTHSTDPIPVLNGPVPWNANGFTLQVRTDNIPVWRHSEQRIYSPRISVVRYMSLGDLVIYPAN